ncbi:Apre_1838 family putative sactipeptide bacteriocin [Enterococcus faecalis]|uniref:Apre_1838 family putative sactipeptide bacteriocin n=1 Tax=Enterococcus faecalis TaxID=1351 RepID=UPI003F819AC4
MNLINPIGRNVESGSGIAPRACMCNKSFSAARGSDSCSRCGCGCQGSTNMNANYNAAYSTNRRS